MLDAEPLLLVDDRPGRGRANLVSGDSSRWVPITTSTVPSARPRQGLAASASLWNRDSGLTTTGNGA